MKMICFSCVLFADELILAAMTDDVGGCFDLFGALRQLQQNQLTGTIPSQLGLLTSLTWL
jgi:hypothetical protein